MQEVAYTDLIAGRKYRIRKNIVIPPQLPVDDYLGTFVRLFEYNARLYAEFTNLGNKNGIVLNILTGLPAKELHFAVRDTYTPIYSLFHRFYESGETLARQSIYRRLAGRLPENVVGSAQEYVNGPRPPGSGRPTYPSRRKARKNRKSRRN